MAKDPEKYPQLVWSRDEYGVRCRTCHSREERDQFYFDCGKRILDNRQKV